MSDSDNDKRTGIAMNDGVQRPCNANKEEVLTTMAESLGQWVGDVEEMMVTAHNVSEHCVKTRETMRARTHSTSFEYIQYTTNHGER